MEPLGSYEALRGSKADPFHDDRVGSWQYGNNPCDGNDDCTCDKGDNE